MPAMNNSRMPDDWVQRAVASAPFTKISENNYRSCPVRLSFVWINEPMTKNRNGQPLAKPKYEVTALCPPGAQDQINSVVWPDAYQMLRGKWPARVMADGRLLGLNLPWRDQGERISRKNGALHNGMTPGLPSMKFNTEYKPQVLDATGNPIVDPKRLYAGVWGVVLFNMYAYDNEQQGIGLGLNGLMLVADDDTLEGGGPDVKGAFAGVQVEARFDAAAAFGAPAAPGAPPPPPGAAFLPPPQTVGAPPPPPPSAPPAPPAFDMSSMLA